MTNRMNPLRSSLQSTNCIGNGLTANPENHGVGRLGNGRPALQNLERLLNKAVAKNPAGVEMNQFPKREVGESSRLAGPNLQKVARKLADKVPKHPSRRIEPVEIKPARKVETTDQFLQTRKDHRHSEVPRWSTLPEMTKRPLSEVVIENLRVIFNPRGVGGRGLFLKPPSPLKFRWPCVCGEGGGFHRTFEGVGAQERETRIRGGGGGNQRKRAGTWSGRNDCHLLNSRLPPPLPDVGSRILQRTTFYHWYAPNSSRTKRRFHQASRGPPTPLRRRRRNQMGF